jgi:tRNA nucleotidyltransferase/poly(A) polymerase
MAESGQPDPLAQRDFAQQVVQRLREQGHQALWAGGCVRDMLLGRQPIDYDVATDAQPDDIRRIFGRRRTIAVGAAFGVINVLGPRGSGQIEVATFRRDLGYSDGRHPDAVAFSSPEEDAGRRDFTINGLFYDPIEQRVIDYVDGQADLQRRLLRAIGDPIARFEEDKLRPLRAVRFVATLGFDLETQTKQAVARMAPAIHAVSPERIGQEMRRLLVGEHRTAGTRLLVETRLAAAILPEILPPEPRDGERQLAEALGQLDWLDRPTFPLALAALLRPFVSGEAQSITGAVSSLTARWRLTNKEAERLAWLLQHADRPSVARGQPFSSLQPLLIDEGAEELAALAEARWPGSPDVAHFNRLRARPRAQLDPPPLLDGNALLAQGIEPGPEIGRILAQLRRAQLDGELATRDEALRFVDEARQR